MRSMPAIGLPGFIGAGFLMACSAPEPAEPPGGRRRGSVRAGR